MKARAPEGRASARPGPWPAPRANAAVPKHVPPGEIEVHIGELVLRGFDPAKRYEIADSLSAELQATLADQGLPEAWRENAPELTAPPARLTNLQSPANAIVAALLQANPGK